MLFLIIFSLIVLFFGGVQRKRSLPKKGIRFSKKNESISIDEIDSRLLTKYSEPANQL